MPHVDGYVSVTQAKSKLLDLVRRLAKSKEILAITRDGIPAAVLLSMSQFEDLMETIEILSDPKGMVSLRKSLKQAAAGKWAPQDVIFPREES